MKHFSRPLHVHNILLSRANQPTMKTSMCSIFSVWEWSKVMGTFSSKSSKLAHPIEDAHSLLKMNFKYGSSLESNVYAIRLQTQLQTNIQHV